MAAKTKQEQCYPRQELIDHAEILFQVKPEVILGALHNDSAQELTVSEVKQAVTLFLEEVAK